MALLQISEPNKQAVLEKKQAAGIDLGTTNSLVATMIDGRPVTLADKNGQTILPSVVRYLKDSDVLVGQAAKDTAQEDSENTIQSIKRLMGRGIEDIKSSGQLQPYNFITDVSSPGMPIIHTVMGDYNPVQISAEILNALKWRAESQCAGSLDGVVITVPAYFDDAQRQATKDAAKLADLNVLRLLNEPTAAAIAYGLDQQADRTIVVYDLGGGTFDMSILHLTKGVFTVLATGGDSALGGDDIDYLLVQWITDQAAIKTELSSVDQRHLITIACDAKERLTVEEKISIAIHSPISWQGEINRQQFNQLIEPLVRRTLTACQQTLRDAKLTKEKIDHVVMVGGSTRIPYVRQQVSELFNQELHIDMDPEQVVAIGAAIQADILVGNKPDSDMLLLDVTPLSLGIETMGGLVEKIISRNTTIPVQKAQKFTTYKDGQTAMSIHVVQGERELVQDCRSLAHFELRGIPPMTAGAAQIQVTFQVDADGLLNVSAQEVSTGIESNVQVKPSYGLTDKEITNMLQASVQYAGEDANARTLREKQIAAKQLLDTLTNALEVDGENLLSDSEREVLVQSMNNLRKVMEGSEPENISTQIDKVNKVSEIFAQRRMDASIQRALQGKQVNEL